MNQQIKAWNEQLARKEFDLSRDEDLSLALMNLVSLEEHAYFTSQKTGEEKYLDLLQAIRRMRTDLLKEIVVDPQGEEWCMSKHLLSTTMRLVETGNKFYSQDKKRAKELYSYAFDTYSLFWQLNTSEEEQTQASAESQERSTSTQELATNKQASTEEEPATQSFIAKARSFVKQAIDCCREI